ncbi:dicarboxylate/amino acid:cation symporter [Sphingomonas sp. MMS24-JH45]
MPANVVKAAAESSFLSLIVFTLVFAFALLKASAEARDLLVRFFTALRDVMLIVIDWVLWAARAGVGALALVVGARAGTGAFGALVHYILIVSAVGWVITLAAYPLAILGGRVGAGRFARAILPSQAVAVSTQSSLGSLPAMLEGARSLGVPVRTAGVTLPIAVAILRATGPAMNLAVAIYVATWFGVAIPVPIMVTAVIVATLTSLGSVQPARQRQFPQRDRADHFRHRCAGRAAGAAGGGGDAARHRADAGQRNDGRGQPVLLARWAGEEENHHEDAPTG